MAKVDKKGSTGVADQEVINAVSYIVVKRRLLMILRIK